MGMLSWILIGLIVGALGKFLVPGHDRGGLLWTMVLGVGGAVVGGLVATRLDFGGLGALDLRSLIIATLGAALLVVLVRILQRGRA